MSIKRRRFYLAHPFNSRRAVREREILCETMHSDIDLVNPFYDVKDRTDTQQIDEGKMGRYEPESTQLVERDLDTIYSCDALLAIISPNCGFSCGTPMEIVYAYLHKIPIYIIALNGHEDHPWLRYHATRIFKGWKEFEIEVLGS